MWNIGDEEREFELQGMCVCVVSSYGCVQKCLLHTQLIMMACLHYSSIQVCSVYSITLVHNIICYSSISDGTRLCTCGGDGIVRVIDPTAKTEIISKRAPEVLQ